MRILKEALSTQNQVVQSTYLKQVAAALSVALLCATFPAIAQTQEAAPEVAPLTTAPTTTRIETPVQAPETPAQTPAAIDPVAPVNTTAPIVAPATGATEVVPVAQPVETAPAVENEMQPAASGGAPVEVADPTKRSDIPHDLSPWGMFMAADWVVKGVMIGLAIASVSTWTVLLAKTLELFGARVRANGTLRVVRESKTLQEATDAIDRKGGPAAMMVRMASHEMKLSDGVVNYTDGGGIKERVTSVLNRIEVHAGRRMGRGTGLLATIGSISPFVGLFGTVWGIMNSFISISESQTTNLAIVAPGIAEALLATAIGLVAAIPAVVFYNIFARSITGYRHLLADVAAGVERLVSRDLDYRRVPTDAVKANVSLVGR